MNILVTCSYWYYADFGTSFIHAQASAYAAAGQHVRVLLPLPLGSRRLPQGAVKISPLLHRLDRDGVEMFYLLAPSFSNLGNHHLGKYSLNVSGALVMLKGQLSALTRGFKPDVVHAHAFGYGSEVGSWLSARLGCPLVVTTHGGDMNQLYYKGKYREILRQTKLCPHIVCVSSFLRENLRSIGVDSDIRIIHNGFHTENVKEMCQKRPGSIVQVGNMVASKKADITIRAFAKLHENHPEMTLTEVGDGPLRPLLETLCQELHLEDCTTFTGALPNPEALAQMAGAQFFCMPSFPEGFGIVYTEALASGCVTIGVEKQGISDVIRSGENGFLVPPDDPEAIVRVIEYCLAYPERADSIARQGQEDALKLTWENNAAQYIQLFEELK